MVFDHFLKELGAQTSFLTFCIHVQSHGFHIIPFSVPLPYYLQRRLSETSDNDDLPEALQLPSAWNNGCKISNGDYPTLMLESCEWSLLRRFIEPSLCRLRLFPRSLHTSTHGILRLLQPRHIFCRHSSCCIIHTNRMLLTRAGRAACCCVVSELELYLEKGMNLKTYWRCVRLSRNQRMPATRDSYRTIAYYRCALQSVLTLKHEKDYGIA